MFDLQTRRQFLNATGMGLGASVLGSLTAQAASHTTGAARGPRAKRVIFLFMTGAPSQLDLFDYKPDLHQRFKEPLPKSVTQGQRGMFDDTLIVFAGEFGRTTYCQGKLERQKYGRDHHPKCFSAAASKVASPTAKPTNIHTMSSKTKCPFVTLTLRSSISSALITTNSPSLSKASTKSSPASTQLRWSRTSSLNLSSLLEEMLPRNLRATELHWGGPWLDQHLGLLLLNSEELFPGR